MTIKLGTGTWGGRKVEEKGQFCSKEDQRTEKQDKAKHKILARRKEERGEQIKILKIEHKRHRNKFYSESNGKGKRKQRTCSFYEQMPSEI